MEYIEHEFRDLPQALLQAHALMGLEEGDLDGAQDSARGVSDNRQQNLVITLNKVAYCLRQAGQQQGCPLRPLSDAEALQHLWTDKESIKNRWLKVALGKLGLGAGGGRSRGARKAAAQSPSAPGPDLAVQTQLRDRLCTIAGGECTTVDAARRGLARLSAALRDAPPAHTAAADCLLLYAETHNWFTAERYTGFLSPPVCLEDGDGEGADGPSKPARASNNCKKYSSHFIWGQLVAWFKQTIYDPSASLSADRRGTVSLPDPESAYVGGYLSYPKKDRLLLLEHLTKSPSRYWPTTWQWSFKNPQKVPAAGAPGGTCCTRGTPPRTPPTSQQERGRPDAP